MSRRMIWASTLAIVAGLLRVEPPSCSPEILWWISVVDLAKRKMPPRMRIRSRTLMFTGSSMKRTDGMVRRGSVSRMIQVMARSSSRRNTRARVSPRRRARGCFSGSSLFETIEMKMMLSMPRMISRKVRVTQAINSSGVRNSAMSAVYVRRSGRSVKVLDRTLVFTRRRFEPCDRP